MFGKSVYFMTDKSDGYVLITNIRKNPITGVYDKRYKYLIRDIEQPFKNGSDINLFNAITQYKHYDKYISNPFELLQEYTITDTIDIRVNIPKVKYVYKFTDDGLTISQEIRQANESVISWNDLKGVV